MKKLIAASMALVVASLFNAEAQNMSQGKAEVKAIHGQAQYSTGGNVWVPLKVGTVLRSGSTVKTAADSTVDCFLGANGPVVRITENTQMGFDKLAYNKADSETVIETELNLANGRILGNVKKLAAASKYEVKVPNGVAGIRGTDFNVKVTLLANGQVEVIVTCVTGQIVAAFVINGATRTAVLGTGESYSSLAGQTIKLSPTDLGNLKGELRAAKDSTELTQLIGTTIPSKNPEDTVTGPTGTTEEHHDNPPPPPPGA